MSKNNHMTRFGVIRYPTYFVVVDKKYEDNPLGGFRILSEHRSPAAAWRAATKLEDNPPKEEEATP